MLQANVRGKRVFRLEPFAAKSTRVFGVEMTGFNVIASVDAFATNEDIAIQASMTGTMFRTGLMDYVPIIQRVSVNLTVAGVV